MILLVVNIVQRTVGFGRGVLFCRWLDAEALGHWEMAYGFLLLAAPLAVLGLPGSFGRYLVRYRDRGQLHVFLRRTTFWVSVLATSAIAFIFANRGSFAHLVFGDSRHVVLLMIVVGCLATVILHHFLEAVFAGLQLFRVVSAMQFCQSMVFAATALGLVAYWSATADSLVIGYAAGCLVASTSVIVWAVASGMFRDDERKAIDAPPHREFWPPLMRFAIGVWVANLLCNLFGIIDRYMIVHCGAFDRETAMAQVGNYHTSAIVPLLMISVANLLVGAMTPHLSHDWELGDRQRVSQRVNRTLQLVSLVFLGAGVAVLLVSPWLFESAFESKYAAGLAVLPWTVASCGWFALLLIAQTYAWCAEKTRAASAPLVLGLVVNVALNLIWLPLWGLAGAVAATAVATLLTLYSQLAVNERYGMRLSPLTLFACCCPGLLIGGILISMTGFLASLCVAAMVWLSQRQAGAPWLSTLARSQR